MRVTRRLPLGSGEYELNVLPPRWRSSHLPAHLDPVVWTFRPKNPKIGWDIFRSFTLFTHGGYDNEPFPTSLHPSARQTCPSPYSPPQYLCPPSRVPASRAIAASSAAPPRKEVSSDADLSAPIDSPSKSCHFLQLPLFAIPVRDAPSRSPGIGIRPRVWTARRSRSSSVHTIRTFRASPLEYHP